MFKHYLLTALRHCGRYRLTTALNVLGLSLGLVCFVAAYATVIYLRSADRHYLNSDRIYMISENFNSVVTAPVAAWMTAQYLKTDFPELEAVARGTIVGGEGGGIAIATQERKGFVRVAYADGEFLDIFKLPFLAGDSKNALREPRSAVISKAAAAQWFGTVSNALGRTVRLQGGRDITVRGVVDELQQPSHLSTGGGASTFGIQFEFLLSMDVFEEEQRAIPGQAKVFKNWGASIFATYVLLPADGSLRAEQLHQRLKDFGARHADAGQSKYMFDAIPVSEYRVSLLNAFTGTDKTGISAVLLFEILGASVLLVSCLNYANLATAQGTTRAREVGMRCVVGATRDQVISQFLIEAGLVSSIALLLLLIAMALLMMSPLAPIVRVVAGSVSFWAALFLVLVTVTLAAGVYPAFVLARLRPVQAVRMGTGKGRGGSFMGRVLVGIQFFAASFLLIAVLVMHAQNKELQGTALGTSSDPYVVIVNSTQAAKVNFDLFREELLEQPNVQAVTAVSSMPWKLVAGGRRVAKSPDASAAKWRAAQTEVNYDFFSTLGIKVLAGREFDRSHAATDAARNDDPAVPSAIIDQALATQFGWTNPQDAIGKMIFRPDLTEPAKPAEPLRIIGVVENRSMSVLSLGLRSNLYVLWPERAGFPIIRVSRTDVAAALKEIESVWNRHAPDVAVKMRFADDYLNDAYQTFHLITSIFAAVATLALAVSLLGLIGMSIHVIGTRTHEIGVRKTLGASGLRVVRLLISDLSRPVIAANLIAWPLAFVAMKMYLSLFTQRMHLSPRLFMCSLVITVIVAWLAVILQATRAASVKPATVLRYE